MYRLSVFRDNKISNVYTFWMNDNYTATIKARSYLSMMSPFDKCHLYNLSDMKVIDLKLQFLNNYKEEQNNE